MWLNITTFVRGVIVASNRRQGEMPPPCSWSVLTTSPPGSRSRPLRRVLTGPPARVNRRQRVPNARRHADFQSAAQ